MASFAGAAHASVFTSVLSGRYHEATTWNQGQVPASGDSVTIAASDTVSIDSVASCARLEIRGSLQFAPSSTGVWPQLAVVGGFIQRPGSELHLGFGELRVGGDFLHDGGVFDGSQGLTTLAPTQTQRLDAGANGIRFGTLAIDGNGTIVVVTSHTVSVARDLTVFSRLALDAAIPTVILIGGDLRYGALSGGAHLDLLTLRLTSSAGSILPDNFAAAVQRLVVPQSFATTRVRWRTDPARARASGPAGPDGKLPIGLENTFARRQRDVERLFAGRDPSARLVLDLDDRTLMRNPVPAAAQRSAPVTFDLNVEVAAGAAYALAADIDIDASRLLTVKGTLHCESFAVGGGGDVTVTSTGRLGTKALDPAGLGATLVNSGTNTFIDAIIEYEANADQTIHAAAHPGAAMIYTSGAGIKALDDDLELSGNSGSALGKAALRVRGPSAFADGGHRLGFGTAGFANVLVDSGAAYRSSPGGALVYGSGAAGSGICAADGTQFGDLELRFNSASNSVRMFAGGATDVTVGFRTVRFVGTAGGTLRLSQPPDAGATHLAIADSVVVDPEAVSSSGGGFGGTTGKTTRITLHGPFVSHSTNPTQAVFDGTGTNVFVLAGPGLQRLDFDTGASIFNASTLAVDNANGVRLGGPGPKTVSIGGTLRFDSGNFDTGGDVLAVTGAVTGTGGFVAGRLRKPIPAGTSDRGFEIGPDALRPLALHVVGASPSGTVTVETIAGTQDLSGSGLQDVSAVQRRWIVNSSGLQFTTADVVLPFANPADLRDPGADPSQFVVARHDAAGWLVFPRDAGSTANRARATGVRAFGDFFVGSPCPVIRLGPASLPGASKGSPYAADPITATGGTGPYTFTVATGTPPPGIGLDPSGAWRGAPTAVGDYTFTVRARDANGCTGELGYTIGVGPSPVTIAPAGAATPGDRQVTLHWRNPVDPDVQNVVIRFASGTPLGTSPTDGQFLARLDFRDSVYVHAVGANGIPQFYNIFTTDRASRPSAVVQVAATPADTVPPGPVTGAFAQAGDGFVQLAWTNPVDTDFARTRVEFTPTPSDSTSWAPLGSTGDFPGAPGSTGSFRHANLVNETTYRYRWIALDDDARRSTVVTQDATPRDVTPPGPVPSLTATPLVAGGALQLVWTLPRDVDLDRVVLRRSTAGFPADPSAGDPVGPGEFPPAVTSVIDSGLTNGVRIYYSIWARDEVATNFSEPAHATSIPIDTQPPDPLAAGSFTVTSGDESLLLTWPGLAARDFAGTHLRFSTDAPPATPAQGSPVPNGSNGDFPRNTANTYAFSHPALVNGTRVYYAAFSYDAARNFSQPRQASAVPADVTPPPPPVITRVAAGDRAITLSISTPVGPTSNDLRGVVVVFSTTGFPADERSGAVLARFAAGPGESHDVLHTGLVNGTTYFYSAFTFDEVPNYSRPATQSTATPSDAGPPQTLTFFDAERGDESVRLVWTNPPDADFDHVRIEFAIDAASLFQPVPNDSAGEFHAPPGSVRSFLHRNLQNGHTYRYQAFTFDDDGNVAGPVTASAVPRDTTPPDPMRAFSATPLAEGKKVDLSWTVPANAAADSFFAVIAVSTSDFPVDPRDSLAVRDHRVTQFRDTGRQNRVPLFYSIWSRDEAGNFSSPLHATATPRDVVPPPALAGFSVATGDSTVILNWVPAAPPGDFAFTHVRFSTVAPPATARDGAPVPGPEGGFFVAARTTFTHRPLANGVRVYYSAFAVDADSNFAPPLQRSAVPADTSPPNPVTNLRAAADFASVRLTWTNPRDGDFRGVLIRATDGTAVGCPGATGGTLVARLLAEPGTAGSFVHRPLVNERRYFYSVTAFDDEAVPNLASPACADTVAGDHVAPRTLPSFVANAAESTITLTWTNPPDPDFAFTKIVFTNDHFVTSPDDPAATAVPNTPTAPRRPGEFAGQPDSTASFAHAHLQPGATYFYTAFTFDSYTVNGEHPNFSPQPATVSARVPDLVPPASVTAFQAVAVARPGRRGDLIDDAVDIQLQWTPPDPGPGPAGDLAGVVIRFSTTEPPRTPGSGLPFPNGNDGKFAPQIRSATHASLVPGVRYYYTAFTFDTNPQPNFSAPQFQSAAPATLPDSIPLPVANGLVAPDTQFPVPGVYQLVSIPYDIDPPTSASLHLPDIFANLGVEGRTWRGFSWTGIDSAGNVIETENPVYRSGMGDWLISRVPLRGQFLQNAGQNLSGRRASAPTLQLAEGWNIVGAPLVAPPGRLGADSSEVRGEDVRIVLPASGRSLTLAEARDAHIIDGVFYRFNKRSPSTQNAPGAYTAEPVDGAVLRAWRGRLLYAYQACELCYFCGLLPSEPRAGAGSRPASARFESLAWHVDVVASITGGADDAVRVGVAAGAAAGWDRFDHPKPPTPEAGLALEIEHPEWNRIPIPYAQSIDTPGDADHRWKLRVRGAGARVRIACSAVDSLPDAWNAYLVLPVGAAVPMAPGTTFETPVVNGTMTFELLVTRTVWSGPVVRSGDSGLLPVQVVQKTGAVRIAYQALEPVAGELRVYDVRGRLIRNWGPLPAGVGTREVRWDGRTNSGARIASGVYFVDLRLGSRHSNGKLVLLR